MPEAEVEEGGVGVERGCGDCGLGVGAEEAAFGDCGGWAGTRF